MGAPTAPNLDFCAKATTMVAGSKGLTVILCSDTPSGKGRPCKPRKKQDPSAAGSEPVGDGESQVSSMLESLPPAPSDFHHFADQALQRAFMMKDYEALLKMGGNVEGRFAQPCSFRYKGEGHVQGIGVQPSAAAPWQGMELFRNWQVDNIAPPSSWVDLGKDSGAAARGGNLRYVTAKCKLTNRNCRYLRGVDLYRNFFRDLRHASQKLSIETGRAHPICFVDLTSWGGESIEALLETIPRQSMANSSDTSAPNVSAAGVGSSAARSVLGESAVRSEPHATNRASCDQPDPPLFGVFFDKKDGHYQVSKARRNIWLRQRFVDQKMFLPAEQTKPSQGLEALRAKVSVSANLNLQVLSAVESEGTPYLQVPDPMSLSFSVPESLKRRLDEVSETYGLPPGKRRCQDGPKLPTNSISIEDLKTSFRILQEDSCAIEDEDIVVYKVVLAEDGRPNGSDGDGAANETDNCYFYLGNKGSDEKSFSASSIVTEGPTGTFYNAFLPEHEEHLSSLPCSVVRWPWKLTVRSMFRHNFGAQEQWSNFPSTYALARELGGKSEVTVYAHNVSDAAARTGGVFQRCVRINPRAHVDVCMVLNTEDQSTFIGKSFGAQFLPNHLVLKEGVLQLVWPVDLQDLGPKP